MWSGMQEASLRSSGKVSFLAVYGPDTQANAVPQNDVINAVENVSVR